MSEKYFQTHKIWLRDFPVKLWMKFNSGEEPRMITCMYFAMDSCITCITKTHLWGSCASRRVPMGRQVCPVPTYTGRCGGRSRWACWWRVAPEGPGRTASPYPPHRKRTGPRSWRSQESSHSFDVRRGFEISHPIFEKDPPETGHRDVLVRSPLPQTLSS